MVSLWPWRSDDTSPASFERTLATLSAKISRSQQLLDQLRQRSRRFKALWTLYTSFAYVLCAIILALVVGWKNWGPWEYSAMAGGPLFIYLIRAGISTYYTHRIDVVTYRLEEQQTERAKTIDKLKAATKYNSTQELLEKYGGASPSQKPKGQTAPKGTSRKTQVRPQRTSIGPPATANIPRNQPISSQPATPQPMPSYVGISRTPPSIPNSPISNSRVGPPEFAPNAFGSIPQYDRSSELNTEGKWYDRILDLLLGEDETSPKNRIVLICKHCRLVNGQIPPGIKRMEELGKWRCIGCGGWNGDVDEGEKIVEEIKEKAAMETRDQLEMSNGDESFVDGLPKGREESPEEKTPEDEEYEEISEGDNSKEESTRRSRSER